MFCFRSRFSKTVAVVCAAWALAERSGSAAEAPSFFPEGTREPVLWPLRLDGPELPPILLRLRQLLEALRSSRAGIAAGGECDGSEPCIQQLRAIQLDYSGQGGTVALVWRIESGPFDELVVSVNGRLRQTISGDAEGVLVGKMPLGRHGFDLEGHKGGRIVVRSAELQVVPTSPVPPVEIHHWISYGLGPGLERGFLEIDWREPEGLLEPYAEFEIYVDGRYQGALPGQRSAITFSGVPEGEHRVEIVAYSRTHAASERAVRDCRVLTVSPLANVECRVVACDAGFSDFEITPIARPEAGHDMHAVWANYEGEMGGPRSEFLGLFPAAELPIQVRHVTRRPGQTIEVASVVLDPVELRPAHFSAVPRAPLPHVTTSCSGGGEDCPRIEERFRRGDADGGGLVDIGDAVATLLTMFRGLETRCPDALDFDDNGRLTITDPMGLLYFLFVADSSPPATPGPHRCGADANPDPFPACAYRACE